MLMRLDWLLFWVPRVRLDWLLFWVPRVPCILPFSAKCAFFPPTLALCNDGRAEKSAIR